MAKTSPKVKALIYKEFESGKSYTEGFEAILSRAKLSETTFAKYWKEAESKYLAKQSKIEEARINHEIKKAIHELETKDGQVNELIKNLNEIRQEIESGKTVEWTWVKGHYVETERPMNANEKKDRRALYAKYLAEIRAIRGLDAAKQINNKITIEKEFEEATLKGQIKTPDGGKIDINLDPIE